MAVLKRFVSLFTGQSSSDTPDSEQEKSRDSTSLFVCSACETTYIAVDMDMCRHCQTPVDEVPDGAELGFTSTDRS
jgi:hypothetical protein